MDWDGKAERGMRVLAIISGEYGQRHLGNLQEHGPNTWEFHDWKAPAVLPPIVDYPEDYLPESFPEVDLILSFAENKGVAELLPEIAKMTKAKAVIAAIDNEAWLPKGLARQLKRWLGDIGVTCVTPKPLCSLTEQDYGVTLRERITYQEPSISEFARHFGQPHIELTIDPGTRKITSAEVARDAVCGCARFVAEGLVGLPASEAEEKAGLLHHHFPCMATMVRDIDFNNDTLMHASGNVMKADVAKQVRPHIDIQYLRPGARSED
jgi:hypothetical protein